MINGMFAVLYLFAVFLVIFHTSLLPILEARHRAKKRQLIIANHIAELSGIVIHPAKNANHIWQDIV
jgi:hypothetical protein